MHQSASFTRFTNRKFSQPCWPCVRIFLQTNKSSLFINNSRKISLRHEQALMLINTDFFPSNAFQTYFATNIVFRKITFFEQLMHIFLMKFLEINLFPPLVTYRRHFDENCFSTDVWTQKKSFNFKSDLNEFVGTNFKKSRIHSSQSITRLR